MFQVRTLIKMLTTCHQYSDKKSSEAYEKNLYVQLFEDKYIQKTQQFYEKLS